MKKSKKNSSRQNIKNKKINQKELFTENPFFLAFLVVVGALAINYLLESEFTKNLFNWTGYYFNFTLYQINSVVQSAFKDHPFIKIPLLLNPITPAFMDVINPWMWLRGFIVSSFVVGQYITLVQIKIIESRNVVAASILTGISQFAIYAAPHSALFSPAFLMILMQKFYINILVLIFVSLVGLFVGLEYAVFLLRNEKISVTSKSKDRPDINVKVVDKWDNY